jgi:uncharacterized integral membrane protein
MTQQPPEPYPHQPPPDPASYSYQAPVPPGDPRVYTGGPVDVPPLQAPPTAGLTKKGQVRRTVFSALWVGLIGAALVLILLLIFIVQNSADVTVHYLGLHGRVPIAVALLLSAIAGLLLIAIPGTARIVQLRNAVQKNARRDTL